MDPGRVVPLPQHGWQGTAQILVGFHDRIESILCIRQCFGNGVTLRT